MSLTKKSLLQTWHSKNLSVVLFAYVLISVIATAQGLFSGPKVYIPGGHSYISYNNFRIFKLSFYHLLQGKDIYQLFPDEHWDLQVQSCICAVLRNIVVDAGFDRPAVVEPH